MAWLPWEEKTKNKTKRNRNTSITNRAGEKEPNGRACVATKSIRSEKKILKTSQEMFSNAQVQKSGMRVPCTTEWSIIYNQNTESKG